MHHLDIDIPATLRPASFKLTDCSQYDGALPVEGGSISVTPPGCSDPVIFQVTKDFTLILNSNLLHLNPTDSLPLPALPDGSYLIHYAVKPHNKVSIDFLYFRSVKQELRYIDAVSKLQCQQGILTSKEYNQCANTLLWIDQLMKASRYMAEERHDLRKANQMYIYTDQQLDKFSNYVR